MIMTKNNPSLNPQNLGEYDWYYENPKSLVLVHETRDKQGNYIQTDQIKIRYSKLLKSMRRCGYIK